MLEKKHSEQSRKKKINKEHYISYTVNETVNMEKKNPTMHHISEMSTIYLLMGPEFIMWEKGFYKASTYMGTMNKVYHKYKTTVIE